MRQDEGGGNLETETYKTVYKTVYANPKKAKTEHFLIVKGEKTEPIQPPTLSCLLNIKYVSIIDGQLNEN